MTRKYDLFGNLVRYLLDKSEDFVCDVRFKPGERGIEGTLYLSQVKYRISMVEIEKEK